jgi:hypothetical protein
MISPRLFFQRLFNGSMDFRWTQEGNKWTLEPVKKLLYDKSRVTVEQIDDTFWQIFVGGAPLSLRYDSPAGAKLDAWQFLSSKRRFLLGTFAELRLIDG